LKFGDIHGVDLPDRGGREQRGQRPALIWQDTDAYPGLPTVVIIPLTSKMDSMRYAATVLIQPSETNGLRVPSVALVFQLGASDGRRIRERMGSLEATELGMIRTLASRLLKLT
jgi:mRNA interferase MazF